MRPYNLFYRCLGSRRRVMAKGPVHDPSGLSAFTAAPGSPVLSDLVIHVLQVEHAGNEIQVSSGEFGGDPYFDFIHIARYAVYMTPFPFKVLRTVPGGVVFCLRIEGPLLARPGIVRELVTVIVKGGYIRVSRLRRSCLRERSSRTGLVRKAGVFAPCTIQLTSI